VTYRASILRSIADIDASSWNALAGTAQPFLRHEFLLALEASGCTVPRNGWAPEHLILKDIQNRVIGAIPLFRKEHSRGEFVFDFAWAGAYAQHGLHYYPKLIAAVPFTPVSGSRLLVSSATDPTAARSALVKAVC